MVRVRNDFSLQYKEKKIALEAKKESLWKGGDLGKWKVNQDELKITMAQLSNDKNMAKKAMLPTVKFW
jgi:hypothetical protein